MKFIYLLLVVCLCAVSAKNLPQESKGSQDQTLSKLANSAESNESKSEIDTEERLEEEQENAEEEKENAAELAEKERKKAAKEQKKIEKEKKKEAEEKAKEQKKLIEDLEKNERKSQEKINGKLQKIRLELSKNIQELDTKIASFRQAPTPWSGSVVARLERKKSFLLDLQQRIPSPDDSNQGVDGVASNGQDINNNEKSVSDTSSNSQTSNVGITADNTSALSDNGNSVPSESNGRTPGGSNIHETPNPAENTNSARKNSALDVPNSKNEAGSLNQDNNNKPAVLASEPKINADADVETETETDNELESPTPSNVSPKATNEAEKKTEFKSNVALDNQAKAGTQTTVALDQANDEKRTSVASEIQGNDGTKPSVPVETRVNINIGAEEMSSPATDSSANDALLKEASSNDVGSPSLPSVADTNTIPEKNNAAELETQNSESSLTYDAEKSTGADANNGPIVGELDISNSKTAETSAVNNLSQDTSTIPTINEKSTDETVTSPVSQSDANLETNTIIEQSNTKTTMTNNDAALDTQTIAEKSVIETTVTTDEALATTDSASENTKQADVQSQTDINQDTSVKTLTDSLNTDLPVTSQDVTNTDSAIVSSVTSEPVSDVITTISDLETDLSKGLPTDLVTISYAPEVITENPTTVTLSDVVTNAILAATDSYDKTLPTTDNTAEGVTSASIPEEAFTTPEAEIVDTTPAETQVSEIVESAPEEPGAKVVDVVTQL